LAWAALVLVIVASVLLAVPPVRAAVLEVLRFGAVRIFLIEPTPVPTLPPPTDRWPRLDRHRRPWHLCWTWPGKQPWPRPKHRLISPFACPVTRRTWDHRIRSFCKISTGRCWCWSGWRPANRLGFA
jgi:hypothetical protein